MAPSTTPQTLKIDFGQLRTITRTKLYHLSGHGMTTFSLAWSTDDSAYTTFAATSDIVTAGQVSISTTQGLDVIDFPSITCRYVKLTISGMQVVGDMANVVELELYRVLDISSRVQSISVNKDRDYKLQNPIASTFKIVGLNTDRFFSVSHAPTDDEVAAGFVNDELRPNLGIIVKMGFGSELATIFTGLVDSIQPDAAGRTVVIQGRDFMKAAIKTTLSTKLKTAQDISANQRYLLNLLNISNYEMDLDSTGISLDYFFTQKETALTSIRNLVQACGDAVFYFDETGKAIGRMYLNTVNEQQIFSSTADFEAGTPVKTNVNTDGDQVQRAWFLIDDFSDGDYTSNPAWLVGTGNRGSVPPFPPNQWSVTSGALRYTNTDANLWEGRASIPFSQTMGTWRARIRTTSLPSGTNTATIKFWIMAEDIWTDITGPSEQISRGYFVQISVADITTTVSVCKNNGTSDTIIASTGLFLDTSFHSIRVTRANDGTITVFWDEVSILSASAGSDYDAPNYFGFHASATYTGVAFDFDDIYYSTKLDGTGTITLSQADYESETVDQGVSITSEGIFESTRSVPAGCTLTFYTATSTDGSTWDSWVVAVPGSTIASIARRYLKWKAVLGCPQDIAGNNGNVSTPVIFDVTINWITGSGSSKYPSSVTHVFSYDGPLLGLGQQYSDTLGGDSSIINFATVTAAPLVLSGNDTDVQWSATTQTPPVPISATASLAVSNGDILTYELDLANAMDTSRMSGSNPAAAAITFAASAAGTWKFTRIHPTKPILQVTITASGTITNLQVQGKVFSTAAYSLTLVSKNQASIDQYGESDYSPDTPWITSNSIAQQIADRLVANFKEPTIQIESCIVRLTPSVQIGDRVTIIEKNTDISSDFIVIGIDHSITMNIDNADAETDLRLLAIP